MLIPPHLQESIEWSFNLGGGGEIYSSGLVYVSVVYIFL